MSLYTEEEICENCIHAIFHTCCGKFCKCEKDYEDMIDHIKGLCEYKEDL